MINKTIDATSATINANLSGILIGFSAAIITIIASPANNLQSLSNVKYILVFYMFAIIFFIYSTDIFILAAWNQKNYVKWGTKGSMGYGLTMGWFIIGISLTFDILTKLPLIANLTITSFLLMYIVHYYQRWKIQKVKVPFESII